MHKTLSIRYFLKDSTQQAKHKKLYIYVNKEKKTVRGKAKFDGQSGRFRE
jgi:hypothetical protein